MCSVLLVLLIFVVIFVNLQDYTTQWYTEEEAAPSARCCQSSLVSASYWKGTFGQAGTSAHQEATCKASQQRFQFYSDNSEAHQHGPARPFSLEVLSLPAYQQESCHQMRDLSCALDFWTKTQYCAKTADLQGHGISRCMAYRTELQLESMGGVGRNRSVVELADASRWITKPSPKPLAKPIPESSWTKRQRIGEKQGQEQDQRQEWERPERDGKFQYVPIHSVGCRIASMAIRRWSCNGSYVVRQYDDKPKHCRPTGSEEGMLDRSSQCISRREQHPGRHQGIDRQDREGHRQAREGEQQVCHQKHTLRYQVPGESTENSSGDVGCEEIPSSQMDETHHRSGYKLAESIAGLSEAASCLQRSRAQGQIRYRNSKSSHPESIIDSISGTAGNNSAHCTNPCGAGGGHWRSRPGGGKIARSLANGSAELRRCPEGRDHATDLGCGRPHHGRSRTRQKATALHATVWWLWTWWGGCQGLRNGGVSSVHSHDVHDAWSVVDMAEAYASKPVMHAACQYQLTEFDIHRFSHWQHSIQSEWNYLNPFDAVISAWKLGWSIICDSFDEFLAAAQHDVPFQTLQDSHHLEFDFSSNYETLNNDPEGHKQHCNASELRRFPNSCMLRSCLRPCIRSNITGKPQSSREVGFCKHVSIFVGLEDEITMFPTIMDTFELTAWTEKPWSRRPSKTVESHLDSHSQFPSPLECRLRNSNPVCLRTTDQFHNVPSTWLNSNQPQQDEHDDPEDANHFLHEAPESLQNLYDALFAEGEVIGPRIHESVFLRAWFVHHLHAPQCFQSRVVEINGHWRHWFNDIISAWRDRILPLEQVIFDIVRPNPPRTGVAQEILFDIILSQGLDAPRRAGLVSICKKDDPAQRVAYSVAVSLSEITSGHQIIQQAEYLHECNLNTCSIRNGWNRIPFTLEPTHEMQDGDSFIVVVRSVSSSSTAAPATALNMAPTVAHPSTAHPPVHPSDMHVPDREDDDRNQPDSPYPSPSSTGPEEHVSCNHSQAGTCPNHRLSQTSHAPANDTGCSQDCWSTT